jgi:heme/copper-type cytochrome/quinol oxidase subunit 2
MLSSFRPRQIDVLGRLPAFVVGGFWLNTAWAGMIKNYPATLGDTSAVWVLIATLILGFCVSYHWKDEKEKITASSRVEVFAWTTLIANVVALFLTFFITAAFIGNVKDGIEAKIDAVVERHDRLNYIFSGCPIVKSREYCDALKVITSNE